MTTYCEALARIVAVSEVPSIRLVCVTFQLSTKVALLLYVQFRERLSLLIAVTITSLGGRGAESHKLPQKYKIKFHAIG